MYSHILDFQCDRRTRLVLSWLVLLGVLTHRGIQGWINFRADRPDGNDGHTSIDFGGQWVVGRVLILGHGREIYSRERHLRLRKRFPSRKRKARLDWSRCRAAGELVSRPSRHPIGGPLYPPIHAFVMAPAALIPEPYRLPSHASDHARPSGCSPPAWSPPYLSHGRWWWSTATALSCFFPLPRRYFTRTKQFLDGLLVDLGWALITRGRSGWGGLLWGLLAFKPVWAVSRSGRSCSCDSGGRFRHVCDGAGLVLVTLPFVGVQSWFDWLHVGKLATEMYMVDRNWIFLSRDLFGIPRRIFLEFHEGRAVEDRPIAAYLDGFSGSRSPELLTSSWIGSRRFPKSDRLSGVLPGFVLLACGSVHTDHALRRLRGGHWRGRS